MYSIKKVAELVGIPAVTIRAWENRFHVISPLRSEGGHRLYSQSDIEKLKWLKEQVQENNMKISEAVRLLNQVASSTHEPVKHIGAAYQNLIDQLYYELISLNTEQANRLVNMAFSMYDYEEVFHLIMVPLLYRIGDEWERGIVSVAQEHFSSQFVMHRFAEFMRILPIQPDLPKALAFCPEGEHHHIGLMLFSLFLRKKGMEVIYLGPNTPFDGLASLLEKKKISTVAISVTNSTLFPSVQDWIDVCHRDNPKVTFVLGGAGIRDIPQTDSFVIHLPSSEWEEWYQTVLFSKNPVDGSR